MVSPLQRLQEWIGAAGRLYTTVRGGPGHHGAPSDHFDGERFFNPAAPTGRSLRDLWKWRRTRRPTAWPAWREFPRFALPPRGVADGEIALTFINHVTFLVQLAGLTLLCDPVYAERASPVQWAGPRRVHAPGVPLASLPHIDLVFVSHNHYDHLDVRTLRRLASAHAPLFVTGLGNAAFLRELGIGPVHELDWWQQLPWGAAHLTFTPAQHWSTRGPGSRNRTLWGGLWLEQGSQRVYFAGDTGYADGFAQLRARCGQPDLALLPIGAYEPRWFMREQHMNPHDAVRAHRALGARLSVGCHFGCFPLTDEGIDAPLLELQRACRAAGLAPQEFRTLHPGETLHWRPQAGPVAAPGPAAQA